MGTDSDPTVSEMLPSEAWDRLLEDQSTQLIDVRSAAEWAFVGGPDLSGLGKETLTIEWASFPGMVPNPNFVDQVLDALDGSAPSEVFFICRSGARSLSAAKAVAAAFAAREQTVTCTNVAEGFEGDLDGQDHRGTSSGWKARGLAWRQS